MSSRTLSTQQIIDFHKDGYIHVKEFCSQPEIEHLYGAAVKDTNLLKNAIEVDDQSGKKSRLSLWYTPGNDIFSYLARSERMVNCASQLLPGNAPVCHFHSKLMQKEPRIGGAWEWHQDYGYWYDQGFAFPRMISASIAIDPATSENGCLEVLRGSHRLGRVTHGQFGTQTGIDPTRIKVLEPLFDRVPCEMQPGSVLFFDCNLLHCSAANLSNYPRRSVIMCYNALANPILEIGYQDKLGLNITAEKRPCPVGPEDGILRAASSISAR